MLLLCDIGNTNIVLGIYKDNKIVSHWRISTDRLKTSDEYGILLQQLFLANGFNFKEIKAAVLASVVPPLNNVLENTFKKYLGIVPLLIGPGVKTGIPIIFDNPKEVGADRIVNAVAAYAKYGGPCIVVDFGTATTYDAISAKGEYLGGAIAPGIGISAEALFQHAAKLPKIELIKPKNVIGKSTIVCMQSGIIYGYLGQIEGIVKKMKKELGGQAFVVATGGLASLFSEETKYIDHVDQLLTLDGLIIIYQRNQQ
ncbi:type III pantothenate kinase [Bacillota bacterium LX-D]|nr:type III pantothenate kinase [Bacillota bacterium LX-D]